MRDTSKVSDSAYFKQVDGGWVFRAPNPWIFGEAPHYLVDTDTKARISEIVRRPGPFWGLLFLITYVIGCVALAVLATQALGFAPDPNKASWLELSAFVALVLIPTAAVLPIVAAYQSYNLRAVLSDAKPTHLRISAREINQELHDRVPRSHYVRIAAAWTFIALLQFGVLVFFAARYSLKLDFLTCLGVLQLVFAIGLAAVFFMRAAAK